MFFLNFRTEFQNQQFQQFCLQNQIKCFNPDTSIHAAFVERFNRSLQDLIYRHLTENQTKRYIDVLPKLVETYNNRHHRMIGTSPSIAENDDTSHEEILNRASIYHGKIKKKSKNKEIIFKIGDTVRVSKIKNKFSRGYNEQQQLEIFKIKGIKTDSVIPMYVLETYNGLETISGSFYDFELVKVAGDVFRIERVIRQRRRNGTVEYFVKWQGFNDTYNSWVNSADVVQNF